ncbi:hypothetical protein ACF0H5_023342 [Mactra antiquata]
MSYVPTTFDTITHFVCNIALYQDLTLGASVEVECLMSETRSCKHVVRGTFYHQSKSYLVQPENDLEMSDNIDHQDDDVDGDVMDNVHVIFETKERVDYHSDYIIPERKAKLVPNNQNKEYNTPKLNNRHKRAITVYSVEILSVVDFSVYSM